MSYSNSVELKKMIKFSASINIGFVEKLKAQQRLQEENKREMTAH